jgi:hypothetical protein
MLIIVPQITKNNSKSSHRHSCCHKTNSTETLFSVTMNISFYNINITFELAVAEIVDAAHSNITEQEIPRVFCKQAGQGTSLDLNTSKFSCIVRKNMKMVKIGSCTGRNLTTNHWQPISNLHIADQPSTITSCCIVQHHVQDEGRAQQVRFSAVMMTRQTASCLGRV